MPRPDELRPDQSIFVAGNGQGGVQAARTASQSFPASSVTAVTVTWPTVFVDTKYTVIAKVIDDDGAAQLIESSAPEKTASGLTVTVQNADLSSAHLGHVEAIAVHDG